MKPIIRQFLINWAIYFVINLAREGIKALRKPAPVRVPVSDPPRWVPKWASQEQWEDYQSWWEGNKS